jgi:hypothetical protein
VVQSGSKNIELAIMTKGQGLKVCLSGSIVGFVGRFKTVAALVLAALILFTIDQILLLLNTTKPIIFSSVTLFKMATAEEVDALTAEIEKEKEAESAAKSKDGQAE